MPGVVLEIANTLVVAVVSAMFDTNMPVANMLRPSIPFCRPPRLAAIKRTESCVGVSAADAVEDTQTQGRFRTIASDFEWISLS